MRFQQRWKALRECSVEVYNELFRTRAFVVAAALAFYFLLSIVPLLIVFASLLGYLPIPHVFDHLLDLMATFVPPDAMAMVQKILTGVLSPHRGGVISFGILSYLWAATGGYSALIEAMNIAYGAQVDRPWWRDRLQALLLTFTTGGLVSISVLLLMAGPSFGHMLSLVFPVPLGFGKLWRTLHLALTLMTFLVGVLVLYKWGPNLKVSFRAAVPGALLAVVGCFAGSWGFSFYVRHFSNYNSAYGSLGAVIVLMLWFYIIAIAMLVGAEVNAELDRRSAVRRRRESGNDDPMNRPIPGIPAA